MLLDQGVMLLRELRDARVVRVREQGEPEGVFAGGAGELRAEEGDF